MSKKGWIVLYEAPNGTTQWEWFQDKASAEDYANSAAAFRRVMVFEGYRR